MRLLEPGRIGKLELKNRIVMAPMTTGLGGISGEITERVVDWYVERAKGGVGLICVEETLVTSREKDGLDVVGQLRIDDWNQLPGWNELAEAVHDHDAKISVQLNYTGPGADPKLSPGVQGRAASPFAFTMDYGPDALYAEPALTREMNVEEIELLMKDYVEAAFRAKKAGFDMVELICYHGGIAAFLSPYANKRTDLYGRDLEGRMRFPLGIVRGIKKRLGTDFPVMVRIPADEFVPGGIVLDEAKRIAKRFEESGVDAISVVSGSWGTSLSLGYGASWPSYQKKGFLEPYVAEIKGVVGIPVMMVGAMHFFEIAERILGEGKADFIVMARGLIADPEIPRKLSEGRSEDVRRCIRCNECLTRTTGYVPVTCTINPAAAKENRRQIIKADKAKKVLVIGGGPAGMEAARVAALRGHEVTLFEKADRLGGNMIPASIPDFKEEIRYLREWYIGQLTKLTVRIELNREATPDLVVGRKADVAIVATGARPFIPEIPGIEQAPGAIEVLLGQKIVGSEVVVAGGGLVGCETALYLAQQGKKVIVLARRDDILFDANPIMKATLIEKLVEQKIKWLTNVKLEEVKKREAVAVDRNWERHSFSGDTVLAWGMIPENSLIRLLKGKIREVYPIGDCAEPRTFLHAIHEGYRIANRI